MLALQAGVLPTRGPDGEAWALGTDGDRRKGTTVAGGFIGVVWNIKGDLEWVANSLGLEHTSARYMCPWCKANTLEDPSEPFALMWDAQVAPWNDIGEGAS